MESMETDVKWQSDTFLIDVFTKTFFPSLYIHLPFTLSYELRKVILHRHNQTH